MINLENLALEGLCLAIGTQGALEWHSRFCEAYERKYGSYTDAAHKYQLMQYTARRLKVYNFAAIRQVRVFERRHRI